MIVPEKLKIGDTIGVVAPSNPIIEDNIEELKRAKKKAQEAGFKVKYSKNLFSNTNGYSSTPQEKADDINEMFKDKEVKMIWCAKGGFNSNSTFEYLDYELIKNNPKIICGYSDITSLTNMITQKTGLVTFSGTNFKTIATDETDYSYNEAIKRFVEGSLELGIEGEKYETLKEGILYFDTKLKGFASPDSILTGVETRSSSPVKILRNQNLVSNIQGIYPCGEGAGYAGGIMSAAVDGIKCAISVLENNI